LLDRSSPVRAAEPSDIEANGLNLGAHEPDPLARRFFSLRTFASILLGIAMLAIVIPRMGVELEGIRERLSQVNLAIFFAALVFYYLTFPVRAFRWRKLLRNVGFLPGEGVRLPSIAGITEILLLSWLANCIIPAKLGDAYRAYLLKANAGVSFSKTFGTILAERVIDTLLLFTLLFLSALQAFQGALPSQILTVLQLGLLLVVVVLVGLVSMRGLSSWITRLVPQRFRPHYGMFESGTLNAFRPARMPMILVYSLLAWGIEVGRLYLVCLALGLSSLSWPVLLFVALAAALLTTIPFTPGGLGIVEAGVAGILVLAGNLGLIAGMDKNLALSVAILDRAISYWSVILVGVVIYALSKRR
jgi:uncharacterized protein (TIRG00374 family)